MKKLLIIVLSALIFCSCSLYEPEEAEEKTVGSTEHNEDFLLSIVVEDFHGMADEPITCYATITYNGKEPITIYHGLPLVVFSIDNDEYFATCDQGIRETVLTNTTFEPGQEIRFEFEKNGGWSADDSNVEFYREFFMDKELKLPEGKYVFSANMEYSTEQDDIAGTIENLTASVEIKTE